MTSPSFERIGPYTDPQYVAEGGMAWVYRVPDPRFPTRQLALKVLKPDAAQGEELRLFEREAELLAGISHPNLVTIFDYGRDDETGYFYYAMSYIEGPSLSQLVNQRGPLEIGEAVEIICGVLDGLEQLHARGIVHRDIKPGNILVVPGDRPRPVLMDLGIARVLPESDLTQYTRTEIIRGTPLYMSPEQSEGRAAVATSDIFSVGLTLYCLLTGHTVYDATPTVNSTNPQSVRDYLGHLRYARGEFEFVFGKEIPRALRAAVRRSCRMAPEERYGNAREMAEALRAALDVGQGGPHWRIVAAAAAAIVLLLGGGGAAWWTWQARAARAAFEAEKGDAEALVGAPELLEKARDLEPPPSPGLLDAVDRSFEKAQNYLTDAQDDELLDKREAAGSNYGKARSYFLEGCAALAGAVAPRAEKTVAAIRQRLESLRSIGAEKVAPERWGALQEEAKGLAEPAEGVPACAGAGAQLARIDAAGALTRELGPLTGLLDEALDERAEKARAEAERAADLARAESSEAPAWGELVAAAEREIERGDGLRDGGERLEAAQAYALAARRFAEARQVGPAWKARQDARRAEGLVTARGGAPDAAALEKIGEADRLFAAGSYDEARGGYETAIAALNEGLGAAERAEAARDARSRAGIERDLAIADGAERSAPGPLARADSARDAAEQGLAAGRYAEAQKGFRTAASLYGEAKRSALEALAEASREQDEARRAVAARGCERLEAPSARQECQDARQKLASGDKLLAERDAAAATLSFGSALAAYARAESAEEIFQRNKPQPPVIIAHTPARGEIEERRNRSIRFSVEADDPNPDEKERLRFAWSFDGKPLDEAGPALELRAERSGKVAVRVSDPRGEATTATWSLVVRNASPTLELTPADPRLVLDPGEARTFEVRASDPDRDPVTIAFRLDGSEVATGPSYTFSSERPGRYVLEVAAVDAAGARAVERRRITVKGAAPAPAPRATPVANRPPSLRLEPSGAVTLEVGQQREFRASVSDPDGDAVSTVFLVDGRNVGRGSSYAFAASDPGEHVVVALARDAAGNERRLERRVVVRKPAPVEGWRVALQRYEDALERKDMKGLQSVWLMPPNSLHRTRWENRFRRPDPLEISIKIDKVAEKGDKVVVVYEQTESQGPRTRTYKYKAVLLKRKTTDDWQIIENSFLKT